MTMGGFGYLLPVQRNMLLLAAIDWHLFPVERSDAELCQSMRSGRDGLVRWTGVDFGFDLAAWHAHLMADPALAVDYTHQQDPDFRFEECVLAEVGNPRRHRLAAALAGGVHWLRRPLACDGAVVAGPLDPADLADADLPDICVRMHTVMGTVEQGRCEGRHLPVGLFQDVDDMWSEVVRGHPGPHGRCGTPRVSDWEGVLAGFGERYPLAGAGPFPLDPVVYHQLAARFAGRRPQELDPRWRSATAVALATSIHADSAFDRLPVLADALEEAGCDHADILDHCRRPGLHARACWVVDLVLGDG